MAHSGQRQRVARIRRVLARALVVAGATVVGTSGAWLLGSALSEATAEIVPGLPVEAATVPPVVAAVPHGPAASLNPAVKQAPATFSLRDLDARALVAQRAPDVVVPVEDSLVNVVRGTERVVSPVRQVVSSVVPGGQETPPHAMSSPDPRSPLWTSVPVRNAPALPPPAAREQIPVLTQSQQKSEARGEKRESHPAPAPRLNLHGHAAPRQIPQAPAPVPTTPPPGAHAADEYLLSAGWPVSFPAFLPRSGTARCETAWSMPSGPSSQPGTTPD